VVVVINLELEELVVVEPVVVKIKLEIQAQ
jgi:hypothetical protein